MASVRYCILLDSTKVCTQIIDWDDTYTYTPASGYIIAGDNTGQVGWIYANGTTPGGTWSYLTGAAGVEPPPDPLPVEGGGTGADNDLDARINLGIGTAAEWDVGTAPFNVVQLDFLGALPAVDGSQLLNVPSSPVGSVIAYAGLIEPSGWLFCSGQSLSRTTYAALFAALSKNSTVTITIATPGVVTWTAHGLVAGDRITFNTTGALPTGITAGTVYFVIATNLTADTFRISATNGGAAINTSGSQSGVHTAYNVPYGVASTTEFNLPDLRGRVAAGKDNMGGSTAQNRITSGGSGISGTVLGANGGSETHTLQTSQLPSHNHSINYGTGGTQAGIGASSSNVTNPNITGSTGSGSAHNNTQPTIMLNYIIKT